ncbi:MAG: DUF58 domain-containing protein [Zoogloeaceae bacterium]|jgi:uncharacterized protein (DUF58 family)|nr:DUF58 domain-containing protein [Zoogloeaceae bacterium]
MSPPLSVAPEADNAIDAWTGEALEASAAPRAQQRPRLARRLVQERGWVRLSPRRIYVFASATGAFYALTVIAMFLAAINYDLALGHALAFLLTALGLICLLHTWSVLAGLEISALEAQPVHAGETARFRLLVRNPDTRPRPALEWQTAGTTVPRFLHLAPKETAVFPFAFSAHARGWLELPPLKISSRYPLGIVLAWNWFWLESRCLVYPRPVFQPLPEPEESGGEGSGSGRNGDDDFAGLRERQPADSPRHVAWKMAARDPTGLRPLLVKEFGGGAIRRLRLDWNATEGELEQRLSILAGWVLTAEAEGTEYSLVLPRLSLPSGRGTAHRHECLKALALFSTPAQDAT